MDNEIGGPPQIRKEPALIPYVFEDDDEVVQGGGRYAWKVSVWTKVCFTLLFHLEKTSVLTS